MIADNVSTYLWVTPESNGDIRLRSGETQKFLVDVHSSQRNRSVSYVPCKAQTTRKYIWNTTHSAILLTRC